MKAPEKIYMPTELLSEEWTQHIEGQDIEYIRKDVFIENTCEWLKDNTLHELCLDFGNTQLVREFVDNYKDYIKGK